MPRSRSIPPLALAAGLTLLLVAPVGFFLRDGEGGPMASPQGADERPAASVSARPPAAEPPPSGVVLKPPPPGSAPSTTTYRPAPPVERKKPTKSPSARMVEIRRLERRKRLGEALELAEELVLDVAGVPEDRTILLSALGVLSRIPGGDTALVRLSDDPPSPEVGQLAADYLARR